MIAAMPHQCPPAEKLAEILALSPSDPARAEIDRCPRCQARVLAFRSFLEPGPLLPEANLPEARRRLASVLAAEEDRRTSGSEAAGHPAGSPAVEPAVGPADGPAGSPARSRPWRLLWPASWGWGWSFALAGGFAVVAVALFLTGHPASLRTETGTLPRAGRVEPGGSGTMGRLSPVLHAAESAQGGGLLLRWSRVAQADAYVVTVHDLNLKLLLRLPAVADTFVQLPPSTAVRIGRSGENALWSVAALSRGDEIGSSPPGVLRMP